jgi:predicted nucleic acid-binding protein
MNSVIIDANLAVYAVLPCARHERACKILENFAESDVIICVPHLWYSEVATGIRKSAVMGGISPENAMLALQAILNLPLEKADEDVELYIQAYRWAERLGQLAIYDSVYLALAERRNADFYTADRKLFKRCQEIGVQFVKLVE